jgi:hypothetical protein
MSEFDNEFPDEHSHHPQDLGGGPEYQGIGVFANDDEGRHYYLEVKLTDEGLIADVFDRYGEENLATYARTYDELVEFVFANDPAIQAMHQQAQDQAVGELAKRALEMLHEKGLYVDAIEEAEPTVLDTYTIRDMSDELRDELLKDEALSEEEDA